MTTLPNIKQVKQQLQNTKSVYSTFNTPHYRGGLSMGGMYDRWHTYTMTKLLSYKIVKRSPNGLYAYVMGIWQFEDTDIHTYTLSLCHIDNVVKMIRTNDRTEKAVGAGLVTWKYVQDTEIGQSGYSGIGITFNSKETPETALEAWELCSGMVEIFLETFQERAWDINFMTK